eukprot:TRINITY_DN5639_c0_g1_i2.p1 TRINITY_DN5639_c0_g1~~TRINITY_DN5639_c0_g1_i2.p1  ORF type:complete len:367 (+),score=54.97 TRINITY_DN5639_c0_g1_i2:3-1103(+)
MSNLIWAILCGGNGGQAIAADLSLKGFNTRLYDMYHEKVDHINKQGGIRLIGTKQGFGVLQLCSSNIQQVIQGADVIMVVAPAHIHKFIAKDCAEFIEDSQIVILHPGGTFGAFEFMHVLKENGCKAQSLIFAELNSLVFVCRAIDHGLVHIYGEKNLLQMGVTPCSQQERVVGLFQEAYPQVYANDLLKVSLNNCNPMMHPAPTLLSTSMIESGRDWLYYWDGITPSIGNFVLEMDRERIEIGKCMKIELMPLMDVYNQCYNVVGDTLTERVRNVEAYSTIKGHSCLDTRYIREDIPGGLVPYVELGKLFGVNVDHMETIIKLGGLMLKTDFYESGRNFQNIGLSHITTADQIICLSEEGWIYLR